MSRFKIEKGVSRINRVKLQASIEEPVATELALMCEWSNNDRNYVVNELLRFALSQDGEFQAYKDLQIVRAEGKFNHQRVPLGHEPQQQPRPIRMSKSPVLVLVQ